VLLCWARAAAEHVVFCGPIIFNHRKDHVLVKDSTFDGVVSSLLDQLANMMNDSTTSTFPAQSPTPTTSVFSASYSQLLQHPEQYYQGSDIVWVMLSSALVFLMIPSLSLIYAGLGNRSFALTLFRLPLVTGAFIGLEWVLWGYTLTFSDGILWWGGEMRSNALTGVLAMPVSTGDGPGGPPIPELVYVLYEGMFASFTYVSLHQFVCLVWSCSLN